MDTLVTLYRQAQTQLQGQVTGAVQCVHAGVCTSPALALLRAHLHAAPATFLHVDPAPTYARTTVLYVHRHRRVTLVYVYYEGEEQPRTESSPPPPPGTVTSTGDDLIMEY